MLSRMLTFFNPYAPWDRRSWQITKSMDTRSGGYVALYIPTETLFCNFNAQLTDFGQLVTEQVVPFSFICTGWYQDPSNRWHRLMVPSGPEQAIRTTVGPNHIASKESVLRLASACLTGQRERGNEEIEIEALIGDVRSGVIPSGGKAQYEARCRLIEYILDKKKVEAPGCRNCPACLSETPLCFSICLHCHGTLVSHGMCPIVFEIIDDDTDEEEESKRKLEEEIRKNNEAIFQNTVDRAQKEAEEEAETESHGCYMTEVDFGDDEETEVDDIR